jgi:uncharacterized protein with ATP-grasp and redox domains
MKTYLDCIPCFLRQALDAARRTGADENIQSDVMHRALELLQSADFRHPPPFLAARLHREIRRITGDADPYRQEKELFNQHAIQLLPEFESILANAQDPFETALRLSIAGNIIDFGASIQIDHDQVEQALAEALHAPLPKDAIENLRQSVENAQRILMLGDNAGEIVLDRLLLSQLTKDKTTYAVRGAPVINDATLEDAKFAEIANFANVITNGADAPGTALEDCSEEFIREFEAADLIISKGQGNFETLNDCTDKHIVFLLRVKCPMVASQIGAPIGTLVITSQRRAGSEAPRYQ